jgi:protein O-GlcNAc transferase
MSTAHELSQLALENYQAGRLAEAETYCRQSLAEQPAQPDVLNLLSALAHQRGDAAQAIELIERAIGINPHVAIYHNNHGHFLTAGLRPEDAERAYRRAVSLDRDYADARQSLALTLQRQGRLEEALAEYRQVVAIEPDHVVAQNQIGNILSMLGRWNEAIASYRQALAIRRGYPDAHINLGNALRETGRVDEAIEQYKLAVASQPNFPEAWNNLGNALKSRRRNEEAVAAYRKAVAQRPDYADAYYNLGIVLHDLSLMDESVAALEQAIRLRPMHATAYHNLAAAYNNLGNALKSVGRLDEAIAAYQKSSALAGESWAEVNLMQAISFHPDYTAKQIHEHTSAWNRRFARPLAPAVLLFDNDRGPRRRLRVGFVSPDFRDHCQSFFTVPLLSHLDRDDFEVFCYSNVAIPDALTERIRGYSNRWRDISPLTDGQAADLIRRDKIDVLVDLTMHMERNRIMVFARKPAPVQVTWLAYPGTTGLETIDYRISDPHLDPGFDDAFYAEKTVRLPHSFWCYDPLTSEPATGLLPAIKNGFVTFGCLNNYTKVTQRTLELWADVLLAVPGSRIHVLAPRGSARERGGGSLHRLGVDESRVEFIDWQPRSRYLAQFNRIDICLDPFPCPGHTTTLDALWMGVPVVNLPGTTAVARGGKSILTNIGLPELIAAAPVDYVRIAKELAGDLSRLAELRKSLRERMHSSVLMNAPRFTAAMEDALRQMWRTWCDSAGRS